MASLNKVMLIGHLTRDPQLKFLPNQMAVAEFGLAINRKFKSASGEAREEVTFVDITAFGKTAEALNQYCTKGKPLFIEGRLKFDSWEDKNGGGKRSKISVVVESFQFLGSAGGGGEESQDHPPARQPSRAPARPASRPPDEQPFGDEPQIDEADIPF